MAGPNFLGICWALTVNLNGVKTLMDYLNLDTNNVHDRQLLKCSSRQRGPTCNIEVPSTSLVQHSQVSGNADSGVKKASTLPRFRAKRGHVKLVTSSDNPGLVSTDVKAKRKQLTKHSLKQDPQPERKHTRPSLRSVTKQQSNKELNKILNESGDQKTASLPRKMVYLRLEDNSIVRPGMPIHKETAV